MWPAGARFAFTIVDDTEGATLENMKPVYGLFEELGMRTTKTVWVYPSRDRFSGLGLFDRDFRRFVLELRDKGFGIALHGVGSGSFNRAEILAGLETYRSVLGEYPAMQINHSTNPDNLYWGSKRFSAPFRPLLARKMRRYRGDEPDSEHFWGDFAKEHVKFIRNHAFNGIVTSAYDPWSPYRLRSREEWSNYWFSSSAGDTVTEFNRLTSPRNVDRLVASGGYCIVYTHLAARFVDAEGRLDPTFERNMRYLASKPGWFVPAQELLEHLLAVRPAAPAHLSTWQQYRLDAQWLQDRLARSLRNRRRVRSAGRRLSAAVGRTIRAAGRLPSQGAH